MAKHPKYIKVNGHLYRRADPTSRSQIIRKVDSITDALDTASKELSIISIVLRKIKVPLSEADLNPDKNEPNTWASVVRALGEDPGDTLRNVMDGIGKLKELLANMRGLADQYYSIDKRDL